MAVASDKLTVSSRDGSVDDVDLLRAHEYGLLGELLARCPGPDLLHKLSGLRGDDTPLGRAHTALADAARSADPGAVEDEFFSLFVGVGRGELLPYASFYLTGFLNERPLAAVRQDLVVLGLEREAGLHDPEDHIAILCDVMAGLAAGRFEEEGVTQQAFFARHIEPWAGLFFKDLATAPSARFYRAVAAVGAAFVDVESVAFDMAA
ncbi:TorD/DmsD family molecular chaperone [Pararhizobium haloflavum]|uniref:TorD/DmsD family molecular chaperone n=1 Tax=Pararhizobium haloflavum TaxID=2037914 RepID=UPI001FE1C705|nr:molecular chaperone TorD family protein [Pararhizobium haloflavum]